MRLHREGYPVLRIVMILMVLVFVPSVIYQNPVLHVMLGLLILVTIFCLQFFRSPRRHIDQPDPGIVYAPADGKVVAIEQTDEPEFLKDRRIQVSIFMSPVNVHVNRAPVPGLVKYVKYHRGKYLVAWHPKSSTDNERNTIAIEAEVGEEDTQKPVLVIRQIAGAVARRIACYVTEGDNVGQGDEIGFIKFGSRCDLFLPLDAEVLVSLDQQVKANVHAIAKLK